MISGAFGLPGSGKSLWLARQADRALHKKRLHVGTYDLQTIPGFVYDRIYTNFAFPGAYVFDWDSLGKCNYRNCLFLCDEIMMYADSRDFKSFTTEHKYAFSQMRKHKCDFIWVSQMYDDCDKKIRGITQNFYYIRHSIIPGFSDVIPIESFFDIKEGRIQSGQQFSRRINRDIYRRSKYFKLVDSYQSIGMEPTEEPPAIPW